MTPPALFIGRFQPFHKGHLDVVRQMLRKYPKIIIGVGSAQYAGLPKNPFSAAQRTRMIRQSLFDAKIATRKFTIVKIPDIHNDSGWVAHVEKLAPRFGDVWSGASKVQKLFRRDGKHNVVSPKFNLNISGTKIRALMKSKQKWQHLVPKTVIPIAKAWDLHSKWVPSRSELRKGGASPDPDVHRGSGERKWGKT